MPSKEAEEVCHRIGLRVYHHIGVNNLIPWQKLVGHLCFFKVRRNFKLSKVVISVLQCPVSWLAGDAWCRAFCNCEINSFANSVQVVISVLQSPVSWLAGDAWCRAFCNCEINSFANSVQVNLSSHLIDHE
ncbi:hypothetical protein F2Q70_00028930 [Brassica cretica]|uniref:Uncharacterized protein n=1 Tax=Brassica cretica TaxID=69181 RepID=A0A8S9L354_BRACR|nr:hypothetical protein F2Q70_00028930 [Brassica cretica]